jgi:hypothetical protein
MIVIVELKLDSGEEYVFSRRVKIDYDQKVVAANVLTSIYEEVMKELKRE